MHEPAPPDVPRAVTPLDFTTQSELSREDARHLEIAHEPLARSVSRTWSTALRALVQLEPIGVDDLSYDDYVRSMPSPNVLAMVTLAPLPGTVVIELDLQLALALVERLLGSTERKSAMQAQPRRPTDLEAALLRDLFQVVTAGVATTVAPIEAVSGELGGLEFNPQVVQVAAPSDRVVVLSYRVQASGGVEAEGLLTVCYPSGLVAPLIDGLRQHPAADGEVASQPVNPVVARQLQEVDVDLSVTLAASTIPAAALAGLVEGDVLRLDHRVDRPVSLLLDDRPLLVGHAGRRGRRLAVQVAGWASPTAGLLPAQEE